MAFIVYLLLVATSASLIVSTGETSSPFIALWIAVAVFAGIFGFKGFLFLLAGAASYFVYALLNNATVESLIIAGVAGVVPLVASFIIWHTKTQKDNKRDKAYTELASELSHEANKSDVVLSAINDGVIAVDKQGVIQLINPAAQNIIGWGKSEALGLSYKSVIKLHDKSEKELTTANDPVEKVLSNNQQVHSEDFSITTEAGKKVLAFAGGFPNWPAEYGGNNGFSRHDQRKGRGARTSRIYIDCQPRNAHTRRQHRRLPRAGVKSSHRSDRRQSP